MKVIVTKLREDAQQFCSLLESQGLTSFLLPCLEFTEPNDNYLALDKAIRENHLYDWLFFLSRKSAEMFFSRLLELGGHLFHISPSLKIACVGNSTAAFIKDEIGFPVDFVPSQFNSATLAVEFLDKFALANIEPLRVILPRSDKVEDDLVDKLELGRHLEVTLCPAYSSKCPELNNELLAELDELIRSQEELLFTFTSSEIVRNFSKILGKQRLEKILANKNCRFVSIGPRTSETIGLELGVTNILEAQEASLVGILHQVSV